MKREVKEQEKKLKISSQIWHNLKVISWKSYFSEYKVYLII